MWPACTIRHRATQLSRNSSFNAGATSHAQAHHIHRRTKHHVCKHPLLYASRPGTSSGPLSSNWVFQQLVESIQTSQRLILAQCGTLTTLVVTVVAKCKNLRMPQQWAAMTLNIGDSPAFVFRQHSQRVEELTYASHAGTVRYAAQLYLISVRMAASCVRFRVAA